MPIALKIDAEKLRALAMCLDQREYDVTVREGGQIGGQDG